VLWRGFTTLIAGEELNLLAKQDIYKLKTQKTAGDLCKKAVSQKPICLLRADRPKRILWAWRSA
jgi:hypothetical protein